MATSPSKSSDAAMIAGMGDRATRVFISYSRKDLEFAETLVQALIARGFEAYLDNKDILAGEAWRERLRDLILGADAVIFIITPNSVASPICGWEVEEAERQRKKVLPVVHRMAADDKIPARLARLNYIFMRDGDDAAFGLETLAAAIETDIGWIRQHTRMGEIARRWDGAGRPAKGGRLMRGEELADAETWLLTTVKSAPEPTEAQRSFVQASRAFETAELEAERSQIARTRRFQRRSAWALGGVALLVLTMLGAALWQSYQTQVREQAVFASAAADAIRDENYEYAMRLALQAEPPAGATPLTPVSTVLRARLAEAATLSRLVSVGRASPGSSSVAARSGTRIATKAGSGDTIEIRDEADGRLLGVLRGHTAAVNSVAFDREGSRVLTGGGDGTARIWDVSGAEIAVLRTAKAQVRAEFGPDGKRVLTRSRADGAGVQRDTLQTWDSASGLQLGTVADVSGRFSPDGARVVTTARGTPARIWDADLKTMLVELAESARLTDATFSPDGRWVGGIPDERSEVLVWDGATGERVARLDPGEVKQAHGPVFSPDSQRVLAFSPRVGAWLWELPSGNLVARLQVPTTFAAYNADGTQIATTSPDDTVRLWDANTGRQLARLHGLGGSVGRVDYRQEGGDLLVRSSDAPNSHWQTSSIAGVRLGPDTTLKDAAFSPDGTRILAISDDAAATPVVWDVASLKEVGRLQGAPAVDLAIFNSGGTRIATSASGEAALWDAKDGRRLAPLQPELSGVSAIAFSADDHVVIAGSGGGEVRTWNGETGTGIATLAGHSGEVVSVILSGNGQRAVTRGSDKSARLWDAKTGRQLGSWPGQEQAPEIAFSPNGRLVVVAGGGGLSLRDAFDGGEVVMPKAFSSPAALATFSADSLRLAVAGADEIAVWDLATRKKLARFEPFGADIRVLEFNAEGSRLLIGGPQDVRYFSVATGVSIARIQDHDVLSVRLSPNGERIVLAAHRDDLQIWDANTGVLVTKIRVPMERLFGLAFSADGRSALSLGFGRLAVFDLTWASALKGAELREHVCMERLRGVQEFNLRELQNPVLLGIDAADPVSRNPCLRRGALHWEFYSRPAAWFLGRAREAVGKLFASAFAPPRPASP